MEVMGFSQQHRGWLAGRPMYQVPDGGYLQLGLPRFLLTAWTQM